MSMFLQGDWGAECATWTFFHPSMLPKLFAYLAEVGIAFDAKEMLPCLSPEQLSSFRNGLPDIEQDLILSIAQNAGDMVTVALGFAHQVDNRPCLKVAWDFLESYPAMERYAKVGELIKKYTKAQLAQQAKDYMAVGPIAFNRAKNHPKS